MRAQASHHTTLLIPTHERPHFLRRLLYFMERLEYGSLIKVYDSSGPSARRENAGISQEFLGRLAVRYSHVPLGAIDKFALALDQTETPFVAFCADDDFAVPDTLRAGADFLRRNKSYSCVGGKVIKIRTYGNQSKITVSRAFELSHAEPLTRSRLNADHWFSTFYNLHRTDKMRENLRFVAEHCDFIKARIYPEFLIDQLSVLSGKIRILPVLQTVRQIHGDCYGRLPGVEDIENNEFHYRRFKEALAEQLVKHVRISAPDALKYVDRRFAYTLRPNAKRSPLIRMQRAVKRTLRKLVDRFRADSYLEGRTLSTRDPVRQDPAWLLASGLIDAYPQGMSQTELAAMQQHTPIRRAA